MPSELGAMYGDGNTSETKMARRLAKRLPPTSLIFADSGFGIFRLAYSMTGEGHQVLFRLTRSRFKSMRRTAQLLEETQTTKTYSLTWVPSAKDRKTNPDLRADARVEVFLHEVELDNGETLYLVTTLGISAEHAAEFYLRRYDVEHDIRDLKVTMSLETLRCRSVDMLNKLPCSGQEWQLRYADALRIASKDKLPDRPGRSYKRKAHPRRQKSTKFMKLENQTQEQCPPQKPPDKPK